MGVAAERDHVKMSQGCGQGTHTCPNEQFCYETRPLNYGLNTWVKPRRMTLGNHQCHGNARGGSR